MKIGFLLGWPEISGGTNVIFEYGSRLQKRGHEVFVLTREEVSAKRTAWHSESRVMTWKTLEEVGDDRFDLILATWWESPFLVHQVSADHYVYFVQSIESRFWKPANPTDHDTCDNDLGQELCESSYSFALPIITEAKWIKEYLHERFNHSPQLVRNGIRKDYYSPSGPVVQERLGKGIRVLVEGPVDVFFKNVPRTIELCREAEVDEIWLLTSSSVDSYPGVDRVFSQIPIQETASIYRSCDVLVKLSYVEGMFGPPLEMFHCGGTAIVYDVTGHDEYIVHDRNGFVVEKDNEKQVVALLGELKSNRQKLTSLKTGALETAASWPDWSDSCDAFEKALVKISHDEPISRVYLRNHTEALYEINRLKGEDKANRFFQKREQGRSSAPVNNFVQLYLHGGDKKEQFLWRPYLSCGKQHIIFESTVSSPLTVRIDPSVQAGIIILERIRVESIRFGKPLLDLHDPLILNDLKYDGTCRVIPGAGKTVIYSYGRDPQIFLPVLSGPFQEEMIRIEIDFEELSIGDFLMAVTNGKTRGLPLLGRLVRKIMRRFMAS